MKYEAYDPTFVERTEHVTASLMHLITNIVRHFDD
jgi:hypothetical protein